MTSKRRKMNDLNQRNNNSNTNRNSITSSSSTSTMVTRHSASLSATSANLSTGPTSPLPNTTATTSAVVSQSPKLLQSAINFLEHEEENLVYQENEHLVKTDHSSSLLKKLNLMRDDENLCDYEIRINGKLFYCHKCLLIATSDFFKAMLTGKLFKIRKICEKTHIILAYNAANTILKNPAEFLKIWIFRVDKQTCLV